MKNSAKSIVLTAALAAFPPSAIASPPAELCAVLRSFVDSVQPKKKREFSFRTSWGENFKDTAEPAFFAKRCVHDGYAPAERVCDHLMEQGSIEFAGSNVKAAISCLSRKTKFAPLMELQSGAFSFSYGSDHRGALVDITLQEDPVVGGMIFRLEADGY
jgi:hypothetical protein